MLADEETGFYFRYANAYEPVSASDQMGDRLYPLKWFDYLGYGEIRH
jgi:hypothetical protein